jgi:hypothetical protein
MDHKPEDGCEIQNAACGCTRILIWLKLVKTSREDAAQEVHEEQQQVGHGTKVLLKLVQLWNNSDQFLCADSYFASFEAAK